MEDKFLCYGDHILLYCEDISGYMSSSGFTDSSLYLQSVPNNELRLVPNARYMLFQVLPKLSYENTIELTRELKRIDLSSSRQNTMKFPDTLDNEEQKYLTSLQQRVQVEEDLNERTIQQRAGDFVTYGQEIQLRHVSSRMHLRESSEQAYSDRTCKTLELSQSGGNGVQFKLKSKYKIRLEGDKVVYGDRILLYSLRHEHHIHVSDNPIEHWAQNPSSPINSSYEIRSHPLFFSKCYEINVSALPTSWQFQLFSKYKREPFMLCGGDVVRLSHTERGGAISCDGLDYTKDQLPEVCLTFYKGEDVLEQTSVHSLFILEQNEFLQGGHPFVWDESKETGEYSTVFRLRHLVTGKLATLVNDTISLIQNFYKAKPESAESLLETTKFNLISTSLDIQNKFVRNSSIVKLKPSAIDAYIATSKEEWGLFIKKPQNSSEIGSPSFLSPKNMSSTDSDRCIPLKMDAIYYNSIEDESISVHRYKLCISTEKSEEDAFIIKRVDAEEVSEIEFIQSSVRFLTVFAEKFACGVHPDKSDTMLVKVALIDLIYFLIETKDHDPIRCEGLPHKRRQKFIRELGVIDLLCDILYYSCMRYSFIGTDMNLNLIFIMRLCYRLLNHTIKDYSVNELYCAQWLGMFLEHAQIVDPEKDFLAEKAVTIMLKNNKRLLEKQIRPVIIEKFVRLCKENGRHERYMKILSALCSCNGEPITSNQNVISEIIINDCENRDALIMRLRRSLSRIDVYVNEYNEWVSLENLPVESYRIDRGRIYRYFLSLLDAISELSFGRNYHTEELKSTYTLDLVFFAASEPRLNSEMRAKFVKLMLYLHIDQGDIHKLNLPNYTRIWGEIEPYATFNIPTSKITLPSEIEDIKKFIFRFLIDVSKKTPEEYSHNDLVLQMLKLIHFMIRHGLYLNIEEVESIIQPLIDILDDSEDSLKQQNSIYRNYTSYTKASFVFDKKEKSKSGDANLMTKYIPTPENQILMDCRMIICEILTYILDLRADGFLSLFLHKFKRRREGKDTSVEKTSYSELRFISKKETNRTFDQAVQFNKVVNLLDIVDEEYEMEESLQYEITSDLKMCLIWIEEIFSNQELDFKNCTAKNFVLILLDMTLYQYAPLASQAFKLLIKYFSQRNELMHSLSCIQLLEQENIQIDLIKIKEDVLILRRYAEDAESWLGKQTINSDPIPTNLTVSFLSKEQLINFKQMRTVSIIKYLISICSHDMINELEEPEIEVSDLPSQKSSRIRNTVSKFYNYRGFLTDWDEIMNSLNDQYEPEIFFEYEEPNDQHQRLLMNLKTYEPIIELIRQRGIQGSYSKENHFVILRYCYIFLAKFVRKNMINQEVLFEYIHDFVDDMKRNVFAIYVIQEIFRDNYQLCSIVPLSALKSIVKLINKLKISHRKCLILATLKIFMKAEGKLLKNNQGEILNLLTSSSRKNIIKLYRSDEGMRDLEALINNVIRQYTEPSASFIVIPDEINYYISLIDVMSMTAHDKIAQAEVICQKLISLDQFVLDFKLAGSLWPLKKVLVEFFKHVYLDIEIVGPEQDTKVWEIAEMIKNDMVYIHDMSQSKLFHDLNYRLLEGTANVHSFAMSYIYTTIFPCLIEMISKRTGSIPMDHRSEIISDIISMSARYYTIATKDTYKKTITNFLELLASIERLDQFSDTISWCILDYHSKFPNNRLLRPIGKHPVTIREKFKSPDSNTNSFYSTIGKLSKTPIIQDSIEYEIENMVEHITNLETNDFSYQSASSYLKVKNIISSFIKLFDPQDNKLNKELHIKGLKILRKIIEVENTEMTTPASEWDTADWKKHSNQIKFKQDLLAELRTVDLLCKTISLVSDLDIVYEVLLVNIAMLLGGNRNVQQEYLEYFKRDQGNLCILRIKDYLLTSFEYIRKKCIKMIEENEKNRLDDNEKDTKYSSSIYLNSHEDSFITIDEDSFFENKSKEPTTTDEKHVFNYNLLIKLFRFLQLLCEGHYNDMQNYVREQSIEGIVHTKSFDFVNCISNMLGPYIKFMHKENMQLGFRLIDTLTEIVQGPCRENQRVLSQVKIIDNGRDILTCLKRPNDLQVRGFANDPNCEEISEIKSKTANFLLSLLEGDADIEILKRITESLDFKKIKERMYEVFEYFVIHDLKFPKIGSLVSINSQITRDSFKGRINEGFNLFILMLKLADEYPSARFHTREKSFEPGQYLAFNFFKMHIGRIEVVIDNMLTRTYFPIHPICKHISEASKEILMLSVDRDSPSNKIIDMLSRAVDLIDEMDHNEGLSNSKIQMSPQRVDFLRDCSMMVLLLINYLLLFNMDHDEDNDIVFNREISKPIDALWITMVVLNCLSFAGWSIMRAELMIKKRWRKFNAHYANKQRTKVPDLPVEMMKPSQARLLLLIKGPYAHEFNRTKKYNFVHNSTKLTYYYYTVIFIISNDEFRYLSTYLAITLLAKSIPILFSILLLDVVYRFRTLRNVLASVVTNGRQLLMTCMLGIIILYIYSFWGFLIDPDMYFDSDIGESQCQSLWQCMITNTNWGLRQGGGIADILLKVSFDDKSKYYQRFFFDFTFFVIVCVVLMNIVFGIIIDTFAELRDKKSFIDNDRKNKCFICNIDRYTVIIIQFDRNSYGFDKHVKEDHNVWQYLYFLVHLKEKDLTEFNGIESFCSEQLRTRDISWIPLHKAICLGDSNQEKQETSAKLMKRVTKLEVKIEEILKVINKD